MAAKSIKEILDGFVALSKDALVKKGWWPNKIYYKGKEALIVVTKSPNGDDFAINKKSLYDHSAAIDSSALEGGSVLLVVGTPWDGDIVCERAINDVAKSLNGRQPLRGQHGDYFWLKMS
jgi:hypothetical protein